MRSFLPKRSFDRNVREIFLNFSTSFSTNCAAKRTANLRKNIFAQISALATEHQAVNLGQGFPTFGTPQFVKDAAADAIFSENNQYTRPGGHPDLVNVLSDIYSPLYGGRKIDPMKEIVTFNGAQEGIYSIFAALLEEGDEVVVLEPFFDAYLNAASLLNIKSVGVPIEFVNDNNKYRNTDNPSVCFSSADLSVDLNKLEKALSSKTRMIVLNTPHNPTGKVFSKVEIESIVKVLQKYPDVIVLSDEVYEFMCYDGKKHERIANYPGMYDRTISLFSAGKTFSCTGWRVGYCICPEHYASVILKTHNAIPFCGSTPFEVAIAKGFEKAQANHYFEELSSSLQKRRDILVEALQKANMKPIVPEGGYFVCCDLSNLSIYKEFEQFAGNPDVTAEKRPDFQIAQKLCTEVGLAVIPTSPFYSYSQNYISDAFVRLAFCKDDETLAKAVEIIEMLQ